MGKSVKGQGLHPQGLLQKSLTRLPFNNHRVRLGLVLIISAITIVTCATFSEAAPVKNTIISITRDKTCEKTDCIKIKDLYKFDNSTKTISGKFYYKKSIDDYYRKPGLKNSLNHYNIYSNKVFVFVTPDQHTLTRSHQIILTPSLAEYSPMDNSKTTEKSFWNYTRTTYQGVYVDPKCNNAIVGVMQWMDLNKVIAHLASDCQTDLGNKITYNMTKTKLNYCGQECQHQKFMRQALIDSKSNLLGHKK